MSGGVGRAIDDARALLGELVASGARSLRIDTSDLQLFVSREDEPSPFVARAVPEASPQAAAVPAAGHTITAPHVATIDWIAAAGARVAAGDVVARLRVLDRREDVAAPASGTIRTAADAGSLVDYGAVLLTLAEG